MRTGVFLSVGSEDYRSLVAIGADRPTKQKQFCVWIILESGDGSDAMEIMPHPGNSKICVWCWHPLNMKEGVNGLLYDATRPAGMPPVAPSKIREDSTAVTVAV